MENERKTLDGLVEELKFVKNAIKQNFATKKQIENEIVGYVEQLKSEEDLECVSNIVEIATVFEKRLDYNILKDRFPDVYKWGLVPRFDYKTAVKAFEDKRVFWQIINECKLPYEVKRVRPKRKNKYGRNKNGL